MPTSLPRVNAVLKPPMYEAIRTLARRDRVSVSQKTRELLAEALELIEDCGLAQLAAQDEKDHSRPPIPWRTMRRRFKLP